MKKEMELTASIHTVSIMFDGMIDSIEDVRISDCIQSSYFKNSKKTSCKINVHRLNGDILKYSEFQAALDTVTVSAGIKEYKITRVDVRLDSYDVEYYRKYCKLNRLLLSLLSTAYTVTNNYQCNHMYTGEQLSLSIRNDYFQVEYYDKAQQSKGRDRAKSRLELRSLKKKLLPDKLKMQFLEDWNRRLDNAVGYFENMQMKYNDELEKLYLQDQMTVPRKYTSINNFLVQYQESIFTKKQMINLLERLKEVKNPQNKAKNFRQKYKIEYYSLRDVQEYIEQIKEAVVQFFER